MSMEKFISVGIAGHVDHGKTTLVRYLTGIDTDRLKEEKQRGMSIEPGVAPLILPSGNRIALVDVPGHSDFLKNTIRGLSSVDMAVLVVAANDGIMPQTKDHLAILNFLRAKGGFIVLSKADVVDRETLELAELEIRAILDGSFLEGKQVIPFSSVDRRGLDQVRLAIENEVNHVHSKSVHGPFRLWIDQLRSFPGFGTVASGTVFSGSIRQDDRVELLPPGKESKVRFIEVHHQRVEQAVAGQRVGLNLQNISLQEISLGMALTAPGVLHPSGLLNSELSLLSTARRSIENRERVKLYIGTFCTTALLVMMQKERLHAGENGLVQFRLEKQVPVFPKDAFVITPMNQQCILGGGQILETTKEKFRARKAMKALSYLQPLQRQDVNSSVSQYFPKFPNRPVSVEEIALATGFPMESIRRVIASKMQNRELIFLEGRGYYDGACYESAKNLLVTVTRNILSGDTFRLAAGSEEIRFQLDPNIDSGVFDRILGELCTEGKLIKTELGYCIPSFVARHALQREQLIEKVVEFAREQGYVTFSAGTFWEIHESSFAYREVEKVLDYLHAQKKLVRVNNDRFLAIEFMQEIKEKVTKLILERGNMALGDCQEIFGFGRTRAVPILDYLDSIGLTCRVGNIRILGPSGLKPKS